MPLSDCNVLVVEDDCRIASSICAAIASAGGTPIGPCATILDALAKISELEAIDGAVLDVQLGEGLSYPLAQALKMTRIPFMFLTGLAKEEMSAAFASSPYMRKPFTASSLVRALSDCGIEAQ